MRTISDVYDEYRIPPWLQLHQLRVAAVGAMVARAHGIDDRTVIMTDLFHDMGNILKMDFAGGNFIKSITPEEEVPYWRGVQDEYRAKYGSDEHAATLAIAVECGLPSDVCTMIDRMRFSETPGIVLDGPLEMQIAKYGDLRVAPYGIVSVEERMLEARARYRDKKFDASAAGLSQEVLIETEEMCRDVEARALEGAGIRAEDINDASAAPIVEELKKYAIS